MRRWLIYFGIFFFIALAAETGAGRTLDSAAIALRFVLWGAFTALVLWAFARAKGDSIHPPQYITDVLPRRWLDWILGEGKWRS